MTERARGILGSYQARLVAGYVLVVAVLGGAWTWTLLGLDAGDRTRGLIALGMAVAISLIAAYRTSAAHAAPLRRLRRSAWRMARGELGASVPEGEGELGDLAEALRGIGAQMRERLDQLESEQRSLRTVIDGMRDAVLLLEGDSVRLANSTADAMFAAPAGGWVDSPLADAGMPASLAGELQARIGIEEPEVFDWGPDPQQRYLRVTVIPLDPGPSSRAAEGASSRILVVISDVTERRRVDRVRRDFVSNASHELKTPASGIQLLAEAALTAARDGDADQSAVFLEQMVGEAVRLRALVTDLLDLSRLEVVPTEGTISEVRKAVELSMAAHRRAADEKGLSLSRDLSGVEGQDVYVTADPTDLAVALDNLLSNAVAYTDEGGVVVRVEADEDEVRIEVEDTGIGIPAEDLPRIFERFYRVDRARTRQTGGTGLGLSLVRHAAERSDGLVRIDSERGRGTTVTLLLPRTR